MNLFRLVNPQATRVLDIGCGEGRLGAAIKNKHRIEVYGFEYYPPAAAIATERLDHVLCGDIETCELPYDSEMFDHIIFGDVLEHLKEPWLVLTKVRKYLKPEGTILTCIPNIGHISIILEMLRQRWSYMENGLMDKTHLRFFTRYEIERMFEETGYRIDRIYSLDVANANADRWILQLDQLRRQFNIDNDRFKDEARAYQYIVQASVR